MKKIFLSIFSIFVISSVDAQVLHTVNSGNFYYTPTSLTITVGDTVKWINDNGYHNVNFDINSISSSSFNNPVSFISSPTSNADMYTCVFTVPGTYQYDCSVGSHAANGMVGTIIVGAITGLAQLVTTSPKSFQIFNLYGKRTTKKYNTPLIYIYEDGSSQKKFLIK
jgi:plastocyanin